MTNLYQCSTCDYNTKYKHNLTKHLKIHNNPRVKKDPTNICGTCGYTTTFKSNYNKHIKIHNKPPRVKKDPTNICRTCGYTTTLKSNYNKHIKIHQRPVFDSYCDICEKKVFENSRKKYNRHMRGHNKLGRTDVILLTAKTRGREKRLIRYLKRVKDLDQKVKIANDINNVRQERLKLYRMFKKIESKQKAPTTPTVDLDAALKCIEDIQLDDSLGGNPFKCFELNQDVIDELNSSYKYSEDDDLNLKLSDIKETIVGGDNVRFRLEGFKLDGGYMAEIVLAEDTVTIYDEYDDDLQEYVNFYCNLG